MPKSTVKRERRPARANSKTTVRKPIKAAAKRTVLVKTPKKKTSNKRGSKATAKKPGKAATKKIAPVKTAKRTPSNNATKKGRKATAKKSGKIARPESPQPGGSGSQARNKPWSYRCASCGEMHDDLPDIGKRAFRTRRSL